MNQRNAKQESTNDLNGCRAHLLLADRLFFLIGRVAEKSLFKTFGYAGLQAICLTDLFIELPSEFSHHVALILSTAPQWITGI